MLNEVLFKILQSIFGQNVKVAKGGQPAVWRIQKDILGEREIILDYGETYRVCCPFCAKWGDPDKRHRLWISHIYGTTIGSHRCWSAATCFHNNCLKNEAAKRELRNWITGIASERKLARISFTPGNEVPIHVPDLPGTCIKLSELPEHHKARQFLIEKKFDPIKLEEEYSVCYCVESEHYPLAIDKLVFPIDLHGKREGWQCRYIGVPKSKSVPKYVSCKNIKSLLYNYDKAIQQPYLVLVEGVFDVIRIGSSGLGIFGKTLSNTQVNLLNDYKGKIVVFLDPDATFQSEQIVKLLSPRFNIVNIRNARTDPGKMSEEEIRAYLSDVS